jgi:hypothetical protein
MTPAAYISRQDASRRDILSKLHEIIIATDKTIVPEIGTMMGKEMIIYKAANVFKYGLASVKDYMSLHVLPMYGSPVIYGKYSQLLNKAKFQKGCINFKTAEEMPLPIVRELLKHCAPIDLAMIMAELKKNRK